MSNWLHQLLHDRSGLEREVVECYTWRLLQLARKRLPERVSRRVDAEDLVQSVYQSFFQRLNDGRFSLHDSSELWHLLAAMTFQRITKAIRFHQQQRRDYRREEAAPIESKSGHRDSRWTVLEDRQPDPADLSVLFEPLEGLFEQLPQKYRDIAALHLQGFSVEEIAEKVGRSRRTVFRAKKEFQEFAARFFEEHS